MQTSLVSIIVPAYNMDNFIIDCLQSLFCQSYNNIEILVVDDGSTDRTAELVESQMQLDSRLRLYRNDNHGVSYSRNCGIEKATGDVLLFVDADDVVSCDYVESLAMPLIEGSFDCSVVGIAPFSNDRIRFTVGQDVQYENEEIISACLADCQGFLCNKGFLASIIKNNNLKLDESISQSEDMLFLLDYLSYCKHMIFNTGVRYGYRQRRGSAANNQSSVKWFDAITVYENYVKRLSGRLKVLSSVYRAFLPIAYEAKWRYAHCKLNDIELYNRIELMQSECERGVSARSLLFNLKMFIYKNMMGLEMMRRRLVAR